MPSPAFQLQIPPPSWESLEIVRSAVVAGLRACFPGLSAVEPLAVAAGELLENALKFGRWGDAARDVLGVEVAAVDGKVEIVVSSPTDLEDPNLRSLVAELRRIQHAPSPQEAYLEKVRKVALAGTGGLGLARTVHEGGCDLSAEVTPARVLRVKAIARRIAPPRATPATP